MSLLVTPSLINAVEWLISAPPSWREKAYNDLHNQLARKPWTVTIPDVERGMKFEEQIYSTLRTKRDENPEYTCSPEFQTFLDECRGGVFQKKFSKIVEIEGKEYCLYGKGDVYFPGHIVDIKACAEYKGTQKYLGTIQHKLYSLVDALSSGIVPDFLYLVAEFGPCPNMKIRGVHRAEWNPETIYGLKANTPECVEALRGDVYERVLRALGAIYSDSELTKLYETTFSRFN